MSYYVYSVGDALFSQFEDWKGRGIFDIGYDKKDPNLWMQKRENVFVDEATLLISHAHEDHYIGLRKLKSKLNITNLYLPRIPENNTYLTVASAFELIQMLKISYDTGILFQSIGHLVKNASPTFNGKPKFISKGEQIEIGTTKFEVLWPPKYMSLKQDSKLEILIKKFKEILEEDEKLGNLYKKIHKINSDDSNESEGIDGENSIKYRPSEELMEKLKKIEKGLLPFANRICLAFKQIGNKLLFLGDLDEYSLNRVLPELNEEEDSHYTLILSGHHGTKFASELKNKINRISSFVTIHSNGKKLYRHFKGGYHQFGKNQHHMHVCGDFLGRRTILYYLLKKVKSTSPNK